ncbi:MAG: TolC family protein [Campylobacterota bacterium]|nr:TolC family protein [Campylobacterota bacterium]
MRSFLLYSLLLTSSVALLQGLTLEESVKDLVRTDPIIQDRYRHFKQVEEDLRISQAQFLPKLDLTSGMGKQFLDDRSEYTDLDDLGYVNVKLRGTLNLFNGFGDVHYVREQEHRVHSAKQDLLDRVNTQTLSLTEAYLSVLAKKREVELSKENLQNHEETYFKIVDKSKTGAGKASDLYQSSSRLALAQSNHLTAVNDLREAFINFEKIYGKDVDIDFFMMGYKVPVIKGTFDEIFDLAKRNNNAIKVARKNIDVKREAYKKDLREFWPQLDLEVSEEYLTNDDAIKVDQFRGTLLFNFSWQLYNGGADMAQRRKNIEAITQESEFLRETERQLKEKLLYAWNSYEILGQQSQYLQTHIEYSKDTVDAYSEEFLLGNRELLNVLDAEREYYNSRKEKNGADFDYDLSKFRIMEAVGAFYDYFDLNATFIEEYYAQSGAVDVSAYIDDHNRTLLGDGSATFISSGEAENLVYGYGKLSAVSMQDYNQSKKVYTENQRNLDYGDGSQNADDLAAFYADDDAVPAPAPLPTVTAPDNCYCLQIATLKQENYELMNRLQAATGGDLYYEDSKTTVGEQKVLIMGPYSEINEAKEALKGVRILVDDAFVRNCKVCP